MNLAAVGIKFCRSQGLIDIGGIGARPRRATPVRVARLGRNKRLRNHWCAKAGFTILRIGIFGAGERQGLRIGLILISADGEDCLERIAWLHFKNGTASVIFLLAISVIRARVALLPGVHHMCLTGNARPHRVGQRPADVTRDFKQVEPAVCRRNAGL